MLFCNSGSVVCVDVINVDFKFVDEELFKHDIDIFITSTPTKLVLTQLNPSENMILYDKRN